jgi:hypothetical protein
MTVREVAAMMGWVVALMASVAAGLTTWLLVTAPATVAMAVEGRDAEPLVQAAFGVLYEVLARLVRYL